MKDLLIAFYGDDFTGSTDAMECLELNGIPTVLFLDPPSMGLLRRQFPAVRGFGLAGVSRTLDPRGMDDELLPKFGFLNRLRPPFVHYKICSTFDSSPTTGSVGHAIDLGRKVFEPPVVPLVVGAPFLRRYVVFGNLFARVGETTYRLDRHPTMSRHPITPMGESDLTLHLSRQTRTRIGLLDVLQLERSETELDARFEALRRDGCEVVLFDTIDDRHLRQIGRILWNLRGDRPAFLVGSSGVEYALSSHLHSIDLVTKPPVPPSPGRSTPILVVSGSCAPGTGSQIEWALARGFEGIRLDTTALVDAASRGVERHRAVAASLDRLAKGKSVVLYTARGPDDPAIERTKADMAESGIEPERAGHLLGTQQGLILREILEKCAVSRLCVAGGDTCGYAARQLGIFALRTIIPVAPGAPLCRAHSRNPRFNGLEISLKGGQNGADDYFGRILRGTRPEDPPPA